MARHETRDVPRCSLLFFTFARPEMVVGDLN